MKSKLNNLLGKLGMTLVCGTFFQPAAAFGQSEDTAKVESLIEKLSNWGRWGADDQLGTLNLITPEVRVEAARQVKEGISCLLYTSPSPRDLSTSRMPSSA